MRTTGILISVAIAAALPPAADAALYKFNLSGSRTANFTLESTMPSSFTMLQSQFSNVTGSFGGVSGAADVSFGGVPEPASWALMLTGFALVGRAMRRRGAVSVAA